jgi:hypothetical protein
VLGYLSPERLMMFYAKQGLGDVVEEVRKLRNRRVVQNCRLRTELADCDWSHMPDVAASGLSYPNPSVQKASSWWRAASRLKQQNTTCRTPFAASTFSMTVPTATRAARSAGNA